MELTILMPCLNEAETLAVCITKAKAFLARSGVEGEVLVADNGSSDGSREIARAHGARVVAVAVKGYGAALMGGIRAARSRYIIMGDADDSYDFLNLEPFVEKLRQGYGLVMGNRFSGGVAPGAMPPLHRYLGNPVLTGIGRLFFKSPVGDFHCGLRGFDRQVIVNLDLQTTGMEFASEMVVKATLHGVAIAEVPTTLFPDGRSRPPHLRSWRDGWRHLRFLLLFSPRWLFLYPGLVLMAVGLLGMLVLLPGQRHLFNLTLDIHTLLYAGAAINLGAQAVCFALFAKVYTIQKGLLPADSRIEQVTSKVTLERGLIFGALLIVAGLGGSLYAVLRWGHTGFGPLNAADTMRLTIPSVTAIIFGMQTVFASFFLSALLLGRRAPEDRS